MKKTNKILYGVGFLMIFFGVFLAVFISFKKENKNEKTTELSNEVKKSDYWITGNSLEKFDLYFLKLENSKENKVYSPLSIKYALEMLNEGTKGETHDQISSILGEYKARKYTNSANMSFANAFIIKDSFKDSIKENYLTDLKNKFDAEVLYDSFDSAFNVNSWISNKTFNLINNLLPDLNSDSKYLLINALAIDMDWEDKFLKQNFGDTYRHEKVIVNFYPEVQKSTFSTTEGNVAGMRISAIVNNYDIVKELGEDNIRKTVSEEFRKWIEKYPDMYKVMYAEGDMSDAGIDKAVEKFVNKYMTEIGENYHKNLNSTDFSVYTDDNVKAFSKKLKEYDGLNLEYIGIMPTNEDLDKFIENSSVESLNTIINGLKTLDSSNFKEGVITKISGFIPKFKFEYTLNLKEDLKKLGVNNIFDMSKADMSSISDEKDLYIEDTVHKANIEFNQDGIKASAVTLFIGGKGGGSFDYMYDVPTEEIDLTFDKPYMFIIRDKDTGEVWFTGTVYNPLDWMSEPSRCSDYYCKD